MMNAAIKIGRVAGAVVAVFLSMLIVVALMAATFISLALPGGVILEYATTGQLSTAAVVTAAASPFMIAVSVYLLHRCLYVISNEEDEYDGLEKELEKSEWHGFKHILKMQFSVDTFKKANRDAANFWSGNK